MKYSSDTWLSEPEAEVFRCICKSDIGADDLDTRGKIESVLMMTSRTVSKHLNSLIKRRLIEYKGRRYVMTDEGREHHVYLVAQEAHSILSGLYK